MISSLIMHPLLFFQVPAAIEFHRQSKLVAVEVQHVRRNRMLTTKLELAKTPIPQRSPQLGLSIGGIAPQLAREGNPTKPKLC